MNIEDKLFPNNGELVIDKEGCYSATIIDAEIDPIECSFDYSNTVTINTKDLTYIVLTPENLMNMIDLINESEMLYSKTK